jgi:hypothetical protein
MEKMEIFISRWKNKKDTKEPPGTPQKETF